LKTGGVENGKAGEMKGRISAGHLIGSSSRKTILR
jgi:hypothetical protein